MAFVRKKRVDGKEYYQLVESYREDGKVRQRVLAHLGRYPTVEAAMEYFERFAATARASAERNRAEARALRERWEAWLERNPEKRERYGSEVPRPEPGDRRPAHGPHAPVSKRYWYLIDYAENSEQRAAKDEAKLHALRELMDSGKTKPDRPEVREQRQRAREASLRQLAELGARAGLRSD